MIMGDAVNFSSRPVVKWSDNWIWFDFDINAPVFAVNTHVGATIGRPPTWRSGNFPGRFSVRKTSKGFNISAMGSPGCFTFYAPHDAKAAIKMFAQKGNSSIDEFPFCS